MNFQSFRQNLGLLVGIAVFAVLASSSSFAQKGASVSGRVVNELGDPIAGISVAIQSDKVLDGGRREDGIVNLWQRHTDLEGRFSIPNIMPAESVRFAVGTEQMKTKILSIEMGDLTLYPNDHSHFDRIRFSLDAGVEIEKAVITVETESRPQVHARVVTGDGTPLEMAAISVSMLYKNLNGYGYGYGYGSSNSGIITDAEGYFVENLRVDDDPKFYVLGIEYQGLYAKTLPFILHEGQPQVHVLLTLNDSPIPLNKQGPNPVHAILTAFVNPPTVWGVNPENGHAYKSIYCHDIADAIAQVTEENAYLVAINDQIEADWIREIFGNDRFWIGLSDVVEDGHWSWHSGEPVTYTNWDEHERDGGNAEMKDYVIVDYGGRWKAVAVGGSHVHKAILEKSEMSGNPPAKEE